MAANILSCVTPKIGEAGDIVSMWPPPGAPGGPLVMLDGERPAALKLAALWHPDHSREKHIAAAAALLQELHNKIIITSAQPSLFELSSKL